jgi:hypothetical protein
MSMKAQRAAAEARRVQVADYLLAGWTYREMRAVLHVSLSTISKDVRILLERWQKEQGLGIQKWINRELRKLGTLESLLQSELNSENVDRKMAAIDRALRIQQRRAKLLGLDAPTKTAYTDPSGEKDVLSDAIKQSLREKLLRCPISGTPKGDSEEISSGPDS